MLINQQENIHTSRVYRFKLYLIKEIEKILTERPAIIDDTIQRIKIVDVVFAFKNGDLIKSLKKRGSLIVRSKNKELIAIEKRINAYIEKNEEQLCTPIRAYITFQNEEGYQRAIHLDKRVVFFKIWS